jgi:hypothetical protein
VSGLGHTLEQEGLATVVVSLIREHTEMMRAPRALWVPFQLGRPLGVPDDPDFQKRVLRAAFDVLKQPSGPVIVDFPDDAPSVPADREEADGLVCPVSFGRAGGGAEAGLAERLGAEVRQLRIWYDLALERRGRTTFGVSGLDIDKVAEGLAAVVEAGETAGPEADGDAVHRLRLACEDLKAFYYEALAAQPGNASQQTLDAWFWQETEAGGVIVRLWRICQASAAPTLKRLSMVLVPRAQQARLASQT